MDKGYSITADYMTHLLRYSQLVNTRLYFVIYWSAYGLWTMVAPEDFTLAGNKYKISLGAMWKRNRMSMLGDVLIATTPPLAIRFYTDKTKPHSIQQVGFVGFTIGDVEISCKHRKIKDENEKRIAPSLILFGGWQETATAVFVSSETDELDYAEFTYSPEGYDECAPIPPFVDAVSTIISRQFNMLTSKHGEIQKLTPNVSPGFLGFILPESYKSHDLPLWRFHIQPNPN